MRRIDILIYGFLLFLAGPALYFLLQVMGVSALTAGIWVQTGFTVGLVLWLGTYVFRVVGRKMTYNTQMQDYKEAVKAKRVEAYYEQQEEKEADQAPKDQTPKA